MKQKKDNKFQKKPVVKQPVQKKKVEFVDFATRSKNQTALNIIALLVPAGVVTAYFIYLSRYAINFPFFDDFEAILMFLRQYLSTSSIHEKIRLLWEQHSEHRLVFDRVVSLIEYYVFGQVNFKSFIIIGNAALVATLIMLYKSVLANHKVHLLYLMPTAFILFNFRYWETSFWPMAAMQNLWVLCFALTALYFVFDKKKYSIYLAILFGWIATYTSANGMMTFVAGAFVLLINKNLFNRKSILWLLAGGMAMASYFYHYAKPVVHPPILEPLLANPLGFFGYALAFLGGTFSEEAKVAITAGVIMVLSAVFVSFKGYYKSNPAIFAFMIFILITSVLAALTRFGFGLGQALSPKYAISSAVMAVCCYLALLSMIYRKMRLIYLVVVMALAFYFHYNTYGKNLPAKKTEKEEFDKNYALVTQGKLSNFNYGWPPLDERKWEPKRELKASDSIGYFKFKFIDEPVLLNSLPTETNKEVKYKIDRFEQQAYAIVVTGWAFIKGRDADSISTVLCFKDSTGTPLVYFVCKKNARPDITEANNNEANYNNSGFVTFFNPKEIQRGVSSITLYLADSKYKVEINTGQQINMK